MPNSLGTPHAAVSLTGLFETLKPYLRKRVFDFPQAHSKVDVTYKPNTLRHADNAIDQAVKSAMGQLTTLELLFHTRKKQMITARIILFELLVRKPIRLTGANGKDVFSEEANLTFATAACASQFGLAKSPDYVVDDLSSQINGYARTLLGPKGTTWQTPQNEKVVSLIAKACGRA